MAALCEEEDEDRTTLDRLPHGEFDPECTKTTDQYISMSTVISGSDPRIYDRWYGG